MAKRQVQLPAFHQALLHEVGEGTKLTIREWARVIMPVFGVTTRISVYHTLDAMDLLGMVKYDRGEGATVLADASG